MKKLVGILLFLGAIQMAKADVTPKVVELQITKADITNTVEMRHGKKKVPLLVDRHFVCSAGFIDGYGDIITAKHCTEDADTIMVVTSDNKEYRGTIVSSSALQDLALIHIDRRNTSYFLLASSVTQGEDISTLGSPLALTGTQSWGKVAKVDGDILFMDESVLPGNSGGVVFNKNEELVGCAVSVAIVGLGVTHLSQAQSLDSIVFFLRKNRKALGEYGLQPDLRIMDK